MHRVRSELMSHRTAKANQVRGWLPSMAWWLRNSWVRYERPYCWLEDAQNGLTDRFRALLHGLWEDLTTWINASKHSTQKLQRSRDHPDAKRLQQLRGVGPLVATALVAKFGDAATSSRAGRLRPRWV